MALVEELYKLNLFCGLCTTKRKRNGSEILPVVELDLSYRPEDEIMERLRLVIQTLVYILAETQDELKNLKKTIESLGSKSVRDYLLAAHREVFTNRLGDYQNRRIRCFLS